MIQKIFIGMLGILLSISILEFRTSVCYGQEEEGTSIQYEYDDLNRVIKAIYPDGTMVLYTYDRNGNLTETRVIQPGENEEAGNTTEEHNRGETTPTTEGTFSEGTVSTEGFITTDAVYPKGEYISELTNEHSEGRETDTVGLQNVFQKNRQEGDSTSENSIFTEGEEGKNTLWWLLPIGATVAAGGYFIIRRKRNEA